MVLLLIFCEIYALSGDKEGDWNNDLKTFHICIYMYHALIRNGRNEFFEKQSFYSTVYTLWLIQLSILICIYILHSSLHWSNNFSVQKLIIMYVCTKYGRATINRFYHITSQRIRFGITIISLSHIILGSYRITIISNLPFLTHISFEILYERKRVTLRVIVI